MVWCGTGECEVVEGGVVEGLGSEGVVREKYRDRGRSQENGPRPKKIHKCINNATYK